ncbi:MAG: transcriptional repressor LexA [Candidatus Krumholzibacteriia bacterium]
MPRTPPGATRRRVMDFVRERILAGEPPTTREVQQHLGFSAVQSARQHLEALVAEGRLVKVPGRARGYRLPPARDGGPVVRLVPRIGRVQAGAFTEALEDPQGYLALGDRPAGEDLIALTVSGDSMVDAGILPGDTVIVRRQPTARDGDIVVALVGDEATVKRLHYRRGRLELHPANPAYAPLVPEPGSDARILGQVVEVRRRLA